MSREVMEASARRAQIIEAARGLFFSRGYEATSVNDILAQVGISKGAFYHHFKAKEEVLLAITQEMAQLAHAQLEPIVADAALSPVQKLNAVLAASGGFKAERMREIMAMARVVFMPENLSLRDAMMRQSLSMISPIFARIISQGVGQGQMLSEAPPVSARLIIAMSTSYSEQMMQALFEVMDGAQPPTAAQVARLRAGLVDGAAVLARGVERFLGMDEGSLTWVSPALVESLIQEAAGVDVRHHGGEAHV